MTQQDVIVRCPGCGNGKVIAMAVGQLLQCDICGTTFLAPLVEPEGPAPPGTAESHAAEWSSPPTASTTSGDRAGSPRSEVDSGHQIPGSQSSPTRSRLWRTEDLNIAASDAQQAASRRSTCGRQPGNSGAASAGREDPLPERHGWIWTVLAMLAAGVIMATLVVAAFLMLRRAAGLGWTTTSDLPGKSRSTTATDGPLDVHWTDASRSAQRRNPFTLKVERAAYGAIRAKDLENQVITTEDDNLLAITISVHNRGTRSRQFQNWYGHAFMTNDGGEFVAELSDDQGRGYSLLKFDDVTQIEGQRVAGQVDPEETVQDTVVFLIPDDVDRATVQYFRLSLPGAAVGLSDYFRFQVPISMIDGFAPRESDSG